MQFYNVREKNSYAKLKYTCHIRCCSVIAIWVLKLGVYTLPYVNFECDMRLYI